MTRQLVILTFLSATIFTSCNKQREDEKIKSEEVALKEWVKNPRLDPKTVKDRIDSGRFDHGVKEGFWVEYSLDTTFVKHPIILGIKGKEMSMDSSAILQKEKGVYLNGKREGIWTLYQSYDKEPPFYWTREIETHYKLGHKHGKEIFFLFVNDTIRIRSFIDGQEQGIGKIFSADYPHALQKVYNALDGNFWVIESYFPGGQMQMKFADTVIEAKNLKYFEEFYETGKLKSTGFYNNGTIPFGTWTTFYENGEIESMENYDSGTLDGNYKYFHDNGQLWTERIYKKGKLWAVISNYDRTGKNKNPGTIKNGTGTLNMYDANGQLTETIKFINGIESK